MYCVKYWVRTAYCVIVSYTNCGLLVVTDLELFPDTTCTIVSRVAACCSALLVDAFVQGHSSSVEKNRKGNLT